MKNKNKPIAQFVYKSRDESFKSSYFMIGQYLLNKNENATVSKSKNKKSNQQGLAVVWIVQSAISPVLYCMVQTPDTISSKSNRSDMKISMRLLLTS